MNGIVPHTPIPVSHVQVILTDADLAITAAVAACWGDTLHMYCLWHVFKNVLKKCSSLFADNDSKSTVIRLFRSAGYFSYSGGMILLWTARIHFQTVNTDVLLAIVLNINHVCLQTLHVCRAQLIYISTGLRELRLLFSIVPGVRGIQGATRETCCWDQVRDVYDRHDQVRAQ